MTRSVSHRNQIKWTLVLQAIERHVRSLQSWLFEALVTLHHANGQPLLKIFGQHHLRDHSTQSCIFQMLVLQPDGTPLSSNLVEQEATARGIGLREGCMCNPSQCIFDLGITPQEVRVNKCDDSHCLSDDSYRLSDDSHCFEA